jgi:hypothetical protein
MMARRKPDHQQRAEILMLAMLRQRILPQRWRASAVTMNSHAIARIVVRATARERDVTRIKPAVHQRRSSVPRGDIKTQSCKVNISLETRTSPARDVTCSCVHVPRIHDWRAVINACLASHVGSTRALPCCAARVRHTLLSST